jgi:hypothetical protein
MIRYALRCHQRHEFESWFGSSQDYDRQVQSGLVTCPLCGTAKVEKALMTPRLSAVRGSAQAPGETETSPAPAPSPSVPAPGAGLPATPAAPAAPGAPAAPVAMMAPQEQEIRRKLRELRDHLMANATNVGPRFPEEARRMHYGEAEPRSIYGVASAEEASKLHDEGINFAALPVFPEDRN